MAIIIIGTSVFILWNYVKGKRHLFGAYDLIRSIMCRTKKDTETFSGHCARFRFLNLDICFFGIVLAGRGVERGGIGRCSGLTSDSCLGTSPGSI